MYRCNFLYRLQFNYYGITDQDVRSEISDYTLLIHYRYGDFLFR